MRTFDELNRIIDHDGTEVKLWQYWLLPMWQLIRHPFKFDDWYVQCKRTITDGNGITKRHYYLIKAGYLSV